MLVVGFLVAVVVAAVGWERATTARVETARYERANERLHETVEGLAACEGCPLLEREAS